MTGWRSGAGRARVGTDIVRVARIEASIAESGDRYLRCVFLPAEIADCDSRPGPARARSYAARFAAKEAVIKVLGAADVSFLEVELAGSGARPADAPGPLAPVLHGRAADAAGRDGLVALDVSVSHEDEYAIAVAVAERIPTATAPADPGPCRVPLRDAAPEFPRIQHVLEHEREVRGSPRTLSRAVASSPVAWQTTTRALHLYTSLRRLEPRLVDVICLYVSLHNGCAYCIDDAAGNALDSGWTPAELVALGTDPAAVLEPPVAAALGFARALTLDATAVPDPVVEELRRHYDDEELLEITSVAAMKNFWNRFASTLRIPPEGRCADPRLLAALTRVSDHLRDGPRPPC